MSHTRMNTYNFSPVGIVHSPYKEKFAIPRQPGLVTAARSHIELLGDCNREEILRGIEGFSHLWLTFVFHKAIKEDWKPVVRPPRLGGNEKVGVFASRSPFRPNPLGLSVVTLDYIERQRNKGQSDQWLIHFKGGDLLDGTPILDIKPYIPYADALPYAQGGFADDKPISNAKIFWSEMAATQLQAAENKHPDLKQLIEQIIAQQPQPAYQNTNNREYGVRLYDFNVQWHCLNNSVEILRLK